MHKFQLGQEVRVVSDRLGNCTQGKLAKIIALHIKSNEYYCDEYTIVVQGKYDRQYGAPKLKKIKASEADLKEVKVVKAFCYASPDGSLSWYDHVLDAPHNLERVKEMDLQRVF